MDPNKDFLEIIKPTRAKVYQKLVLFPLMAPESDEPHNFTLKELLKREADKVMLHITHLEKDRGMKVVEEEGWLRLVEKH